MWLRSVRACAAVVAAGLMTGGMMGVTRAGAVEPGLSSAAENPIEVSLGAHKFGVFTSPDAVNAQVGASGVGWEQPADGPWYGPWTFEVATDATVWLLDQVNDRLLGWPPGHPDQPARTVPAPRSSADFAVGPKGTFFLTTFQPGEGPRLNAITSDGRSRWRAMLAEDLFNARLRIGPDRRLYQVTPDSWIPVADASGNPLSVADQQRQTLRYQPLSDGRRLSVTYASPRAMRVELQDATGRAVRTWRLTSATDLGAADGLPAVVGADVVLPLDVYTESPPFRREGLVLRLTAAGAPVRLHLRHVTWGDEPITELRVGPEGALYQLQTARTSGVKIVRYDLRAPAPSPSPTGATVVPGPSVSAATSTPTETTGAPTTTGTAVAVAPSEQRPSGSGSWLLWTGGVALVFIAAAGGAYLVWRRHAAPKTGMGTPGAPPAAGAAGG